MGSGSWDMDIKVSAFDVPKSKSYGPNFSKRNLCADKKPTKKDFVKEEKLRHISL